MKLNAQMKSSKRKKMSDRENEEKKMKNWENELLSCPLYNVSFTSTM